MLDTVLDAVTAMLKNAGVTAVREYPGEILERPAAPTVCVGVKSGKSLPAGMGDYLGTENVNGAVREVYGTKLELVVGLDVYSPEAAGCAACFESISSAFAAPPDGLKLRALVCGETEPDEVTELFRCRCEAHCLAVLTRTVSEDGAEFTDFVLRGVLK